MAQKYGATPEQVFFRYTLDIGITPLTGTTNRKHMEQDLAVSGMAPLSAEEIAAIEGVLFAEWIMNLDECFWRIIDIWWKNETHNLFNIT